MNNNKVHKLRSITSSVRGALRFLSMIFVLFLLQSVAHFLPDRWQNNTIIQALKVKEAHATISLVQKSNGTGNGVTTVVAFFPATPTQNNLLVALASNQDSSSPPTTPAGWSVAISETANSPGQVIYYKIAGPAESTSVTVTGYSTSTMLGIHIYEYSGIDTVSPLDQTGSASGTGTSVSSGSVTTTQAEELLIAGLIINDDSNFSGWTNSFALITLFGASSGGNKITVGGADRNVLTAGTYSTTATAVRSRDWRGQIATFKAPTPMCQVTSTANSGAGSLRECINYANSNPGTIISFNIPGPGNQSSGPDSWWRISPTFALPTITADGTIIDGTTQTTNQGDTNSQGPEMELYGNTSSLEKGFDITSADNAIKGFILGGFTQFANTGAIHISGASATGNTISGNYIGTDYSGANPNTNLSGIYITGGGSNIIGGNTAADRNIISGNSTRGIVFVSASSNTVSGNYIGTNPAGTGSVPNGAAINISNGSNFNIIGGTTAVERNLISGNTGRGIFISGCNSNIISGNYIGTDVNGTADLGNTNSGIELVSGSQSNTIGGTTSDERNVISGNDRSGIVIINASTDLNTVIGNYIGTDFNGTANVGNTERGIRIIMGPQSNQIGGTASGEGNIIAFNGLQGIELTSSGTPPLANTFSGNSIFNNGGLGIDLDPVGPGTGGGANNDKAAPVISSVTPSGADFIAIATVDAGDTIEFFRVNNAAAPAVSPDGSGYGEGYLYLGSCVDGGGAGACSGPHISGSDAVADGSVSATLTSSGLSGGDTVTATATDAIGTSEFAANVSVNPPGLAIVKQVWEINGTAPLASPVSAPAGSTLVFLIYAKNTTAGQVTDVRINDNLDEAGFEYVAGSLVRTDAVTPPADTATDLQIFDATAPGTGTPVSEGVDGDVSSAQDTGGLPDLDRITIGSVTGQANGPLTIDGNTTFALRFRVIVK